MERCCSCRSDFRVKESSDGLFAGSSWVNVRSVDNGTRRWYKMNIKEHRAARVNSENRSAEIRKEIEAPGSIS